MSNRPESIAFVEEKGGFTILEAVAAIAIVAILAALVLPNYSAWTARAQEVRCMSNMRSIHSALLGYLPDHKEVWPQGPLPSEDKEWSAFWIKTLEPYGIDAQVWRCPTIESRLGENAQNIGSLHYLPTMFDSQPYTARRLSTPPLNQPWLVECVDAHGLGPLILFGDGSIKSFSKVLAELGAR